MDNPQHHDRPSRRPRLTGDNDFQRGYQAAPARPLLTPQQHTQQHGAGLEHGRVAAGATQYDQFNTPLPSAADVSSMSRWLACSYKAGLLGVAAYDRLSNELSVLQTADEGKGPAAFQMLQYIKLQLDPQVIILSATAEPALIEAAQLSAAAAAGAASLGDSTGEPVVQLQRPSLFTYSKALQMVNAIEVRGHQPTLQQQPHSSRQGRHSRGVAGPAAELIETSAQQQVAALGALVALLLQLQNEEGSAEEGSGSLLVDNISELTLDGHLIVDGASLAALDIFKEEEHPSAMGIGSSKEGVSVYGLLQRCVTGMGRRLLRQWFLRPVVQLDVIEDRHDTLELLVASPNTNDALRASLKKLQDLPRLLARLRLSQARPQLATFKQLHDSINQLMAMQATIAALAPRAAAGAEASAAGATSGAAAAAAVPGSAYRTPGAETFASPQQGRQPGWLFDDADAAEAAGNADFFQQGGDLYGSMYGTPRAQHTAPHGPYSTPAGPGRSSSTLYSAGAAGTAAANMLPQAGPWDELRIIHKLLRCIGPELSACCCMIGDVLDLSCSLEGCLVQPGVCQPLDELRDTLDQLPALLTQVIEQELMRVPPAVARRNNKQLWSVVYIPQVGFVISVTGGKLSEELCELLPDYSLAFMGEDGPAGLAGAAAAAAAAAEDSSGVDLDRSCAYYTCNVTQQLNASYGDLQHKIQDLEASICTELIKRLLQYGPALTAASTAIAELDCLCSLAAAARELGYCRPQLVKDSVIHIEGGHHPLCALLAPGQFMDNDTTLGAVITASRQTGAQQPAAAGTTRDGSSKPRILLIAGPNASGKSVYMKQVALLVYLAHVGSFVPARSAVIGLTDRILTRLPGMESVAHHTSSFMADLAQVSNLLARATSHSLILLDEFGKGTLSADGVGLLAALLQHYAVQPCPPLLLACTHFSELLDPGVLPRSPQLALCTMQVLVGGGNGNGGNSSSSSGRYRYAVDGAGGTSDQQEGQEGSAGPQASSFSLDQEHVFLYKLVPGAVASSYGLHCARLCGVDRAVLTRAADVLALQEAGQPVRRLQVPQLEDRDRVCWELVQQLAGLDLSSKEAVKQLMAAVIQAEVAG